MNLNIFGRLKKKEPRELKEVPAERIDELSKTELSEAEIIDTLKKEGYSFESIDKAMNYAVKTGVEESPLPEQGQLPPQGLQEEAPAQQYPQQEQQPLPGQEFPPAESPQEPLLETQFPGEVPAQRTAASVEEVEEIVEAVTEEKLSDINDQILKIEEKLGGISDVMQKLSNSLQDVVKTTKRDRDETNAKIEEFNTKLNETIPRITSLEKAFKANIPSLIDEVKGFAETIENLKMKKKISK